MKKKRQINNGLKAWNEARSLFFRENRRLGKKYTVKQINQFTKAFRAENPISFTESDFKFFVRTELPDFYNNPINLEFKELVSQVYYSMDSAIQSLPKDINVRVNSGWVSGVIEFNTSDYIYSASGLQDIVEDIREEVEDKESKYRYPSFEGVIKRVDGADPNSEYAKDYYLDYILFIYGESVDVIKGDVEPKGKITETGIVEKVSKRKYVKKPKGKKRTPKTVPLEKYRELEKKQAESDKKIAELQRQVELLMKKIK